MKSVSEEGNFDNEVLAYLSVRKDELIQSHEEYILNHPEIREVLNDFLSSVLLHKPVRPSLISRTMSLCMLKSTSILSTPLLLEESLSSWWDLQE
jgi:hypothetical protein